MKYTLTLAGAAALIGTTAAAVAEVPSPVKTIRTEAGNIQVSEVTGGLENPWAIAFLPDGRILVTEKKGKLRLISADGELQKEPVEGTPTVFAQGQGGLLDIELDPNFAENNLVWMTFAEPGDDGKAGTALGRAAFNDGKLSDWKTVWRQEKVEGSKHFGSRIVFADDETIFVALAERFKFDPAQDKSNTLGTVIRIGRDGKAKADNPFVNDEDAKPEIYSFGHRNIQAAAMDSATGDLYVTEMGPLGGDELNRIEKGANYGWPLVSWGTDYDGSKRADPSTRPDLKDAVTYWSPVLSPSGMIFYDGDKFPSFKGQAMIGGLVSEGITRVKLSNGKVEAQAHIPLSKRIRDVAQGPEGDIYVLIDGKKGKLWKLAPQTAVN